MRKEIICGIYKITSPTGRIYIGQSNDIYKRWDLYRLNHCKSQTKLYRSINKYGWSNHAKEIIEVCPIDTLNDREFYWISYFKSYNTYKGLNCTMGGEGSRGKIWTQKERERQSNRQKGIQSGEKNGMFGKKHSLEIIDHLRKQAIGRVVSEQSKDNIRNALIKKYETIQHHSKGKKQSPSLIAKRVIKNTGKKRTEETKKLMSQKAMGNQRWLGRKHTSERNEKFKNWWKMIKDTEWYNSPEQKLVRSKIAKKAALSSHSTK